MVLKRPFSNHLFLGHFGNTFSKSLAVSFTKLWNNYFPYSRLNPRQQKNFSPLKFSFPVIKWLAFLLEMILNG
jgi:hypothetical protein